MGQSTSVCEERVFEQVFMNESEGLRNFLYYKCGNMKQSEDWVQEAFLRMWNNCAKVPFGKAKSFLYTVANNLFLNEVKHRKVVLKFEQHGHIDRDQENPQFLLEVEEFQQRLESAIGALPEGQREVFLMNRIDKLKYREIAEKLNISVKAVEKRMHKALGTLKKISKKV